MDRKTPGGFLFAMFDFTIPILEQLLERQFRYFQCVTFPVTLNRALTLCDVACCTWFLILSFIETNQNKEKSEKDRKLNRFLGIKVAITAKIAL